MNLTRVAKFDTLKEWQELPRNDIEKEGSEMSKTITPTEFGTSKEVGFDKETRQALADFIEAGNAEKLAKERRAVAEQILREKLGLAEIATIGGVAAFKIAHRNRTDIKRDVLKENFPEVFAEVSYENPYDFISAVK
jgi:hypothetical protein